MIAIKNPKIVGNQAFADLEVKSGCCCKTIHVVADIKDNKLFTNIVNIDTFQEIYVGIWPDLIEEWKKVI